MNTTTLMMMSGRRAALRAAVLSSRKMNALSVRPCFVSLGRRMFGAQMQADDHDDDTKNKNTPPKLSQKDQLMAGYQEYLDRMMDTTNKIESSMEALKGTYAEKQKQRAASTTIKWMDSSEMDRLFDESGKHKQDIAAELAELKSLLKDATAANFNAVDAPDGESDWHLKEEMEEIKHIIDDAAVLEDKDEVNQRHRAETAAAYNAVDAPDGETDGHLKEEMEEIKRIIDDAAVLENKDEVLQQRKMQEEGKRVFAVDAPDGDSDGHVQEELEEIKHIIDDTSAIEDKNRVEYKHMMEKQVHKDRARDPEHDW